MADEIQQNQEQFPSAPPPPQEVKVRTMRSDLASMAQSGGGLPQFQKVRINSPLAEDGERRADSGPKRISLGIAITIVAIVLVLIAVGYLILKH